jgi:hypothetical protein
MLNNDVEAVDNQAAWEAAQSDLETKSGPLVARGFALADRFGHSLWWLEEGQPKLIMISVEGTSDQAWPISPPFQELVMENIAAGGRPTLLAVGKAGKSHWSAAIEGDAFSEAIAFDIACRTVEAPPLLGSVYRVSNEWSIERLAPNALRLMHRTGLSVHMDVIGEAVLDWSEQRLAIKPPLDATVHQRGKTYRWRYVCRRS